MIKFFAVILLMSGLSFSYLSAQNSPEEVSFLFYNVENLFDTTNDPATDDDAFTPEGDLHWNTKRLNAKLLNISKVILNSGGWNSPIVIGMCEIENKRVLEMLVSQTPLKSLSYKIIHKESNDHRGIDVAFIYRPDFFYPLEYHFYPICTEEKSEIKTREILYVQGIIASDTVHIFVNHWPSRYSGLLETQPLRELAAELLKSKIDYISENYFQPKIVLMGDFNDNPEDQSISDVLQAKLSFENISSPNIYNLMAPNIKPGSGTLKFQSQWYTFDQFLVSGSLLKNTPGLKCSEDNAVILEFPYLFEKDEKFGGLKPKRTYNGYTYNGGFSDHLPILLKMEIKD